MVAYSCSGSLQMLEPVPVDNKGEAALCTQLRIMAVTEINQEGHISRHTILVHATYCSTYLVNVINVNIVEV